LLAWAGAFPADTGVNAVPLCPARAWIAPEEDRPTMTSTLSAAAFNSTCALHFFHHPVNISLNSFKLPSAASDKR
jgi:hypothetical protein